MQRLGQPAKRAGIVGLADYVRAPEGTALSSSMKIVTDGLPEVEFVNLSEETEEIRLDESEGGRVSRAVDGDRCEGESGITSRVPRN